MQRLVLKGAYSKFVLKRAYSNVSGGDPWHGSYHWLYERGLSVATLGLVSAAAFLPSSKLVDFGLGVVLPLHSHLGFMAIITDYLPKRKFPRIYPLATGALYAATAGCLYGLYLYNTKDVGITEGVKKLWHGPAKQEQED